jgi:hypothetical protein
MSDEERSRLLALGYRSELIDRVSIVHELKSVHYDLYAQIPWATLADFPANPMHGYEIFWDAREEMERRNAN